MDEFYKDLFGDDPEFGETLDKILGGKSPTEFRDERFKKNLKTFVDAFKEDEQDAKKSTEGKILISQHVVDVAVKLVELTEDDDPADVMRRALGVYKAMVEHCAEGGSVQFVGPDGRTGRVLKVQLRRDKG